MAVGLEILALSWCFSSCRRGRRARVRAARLVKWDLRPEDSPLLEGRRRKRSRTFKVRMGRTLEFPKQVAPRNTVKKRFLPSWKLGLGLKIPTSRARASSTGIVIEEEPWIPMSGPLTVPKSDHWIPSSGPLVPYSGASLARKQKHKEANRISRVSQTSRKQESSKQKIWNPLKENWQEVLETVLSKDFDNLVDLEEFLGYYFLLTSDTYRGLVEQVFKEFCDDFTLPLDDLMPRGTGSLCNSSDKELECLPPSPCSRGTLAWFNELHRDFGEHVSRS